MIAKKRPYIGKRCKEIRNELKLTQENLVVELGAESQTTISNLENKGMTGDFLWVYIEFLYKRGFNPAWIVIEDNSAIPKKLDKTIGTKYYKDQINTISEIAELAIEQNVKLQQISKELNELSPSKL